MSYEDNVRAAAAALQRGEDIQRSADEFKYELARLTWETVPPMGGTSIRRWSGDVVTAARGAYPFGENKAAHYRDIWANVRHQPISDRPPFQDAYAQVRGGTVEERMVPTNFKNLLTHATPEFKREAFATLAHEPEVVADLETSTHVFSQIVRDNPVAVQEAYKDTQTNIALANARWRARDDLIQPLRDARVVFEPKDSSLDRRVFLADVAAKVEQWTRELDGIRDFLELTDDVDRMRRWVTRQALDRLVEVATACRDVLPSSYEEEVDVVTPVPIPVRKLA